MQHMNKQKEGVFDLEKEILSYPKKKKELLSKTDTTINELKKSMRQGGSKKEVEQCGILLQGYDALHKVISKI